MYKKENKFNRRRTLCWRNWFIFTGEWFNFLYFYL